MMWSVAQDFGTLLQREGKRDLRKEEWKRKKRHKEGVEFCLSQSQILKASTFQDSGKIRDYYLRTVNSLFMQ